MDCVDCHNRPTHVYRLPEEEVDAAFQDGLLPRDLPFLRREAVRILSEEYPSQEEARAGISAELTRFYETDYPELAVSRRGNIEDAGRVLGDLFGLNVFPEMKVTWGTYPDHIGHEQSAGCFRCHDDLHATTDGETIAQDCFECHSLLAIEEEEPEILSTLDL